LSYQQQQFELQTRIGKIEQEFQQELLHTQIEVQEQILTNVSAEIHDNIGLSLVMVNMNLHTVNSPLSESDVYKLQKSQDLVSNVLQDLRQLSKSLNTDFVKKLGLLDAIDQQVQMIRKTSVINCELEVQGNVERYTPEHELLIFRVIQELITNTIKHANATGLNILVQYYSGRMLVTVRDNGQGFDVNSDKSISNGLGLQNMKNRISLINGNFHIDSSIGGTVTTIEVFAR
jgi:signal transduction histidine kinase